MRRIVCREFGPPELLAAETAPDPEPGPGEVLMAVRAAGLSFVDTLITSGRYQVRPPLPFTPGLVTAGEVVRAGPQAGDWPPGTRVAGCSFGLGGYASHRVLPAHALVPLPGAVADEVAASAIESYATMLFALRERISVRPGEWVLVLGAAGGIGLAAVDVARSLGARVVAAASTPAKRDAAARAGAEAVIDYQAGDLRARVREITGEGAGVVVDPVGGEYAEPALRSLRGGGRYLVVGFAGGTIPQLPANRILLENRAVVGVDWGAWSRHDPQAAAALTAGLLDLIADGELHPVPPAAVALESAGQALADLAGRRVTGKLVLIPGRPPGLDVAPGG